MIKQYVFDTSALIYDPSVWKKFPNSMCIIPIAVLNELDKLKKQSNEAGRNARVAIRLIDDTSDKGDISTGILLDNEALIKVDATYNDLSDPNYNGFGDPSYGDTQILACLYSNWLINNDTTLVSNDINLRIKAKSRAIDAESYEGDKQAISDLYCGAKIIINEDAGIDLIKSGKIDMSKYSLDLNSNECVSFRADNGDEISFGRKVSDNQVKIIKKQYPWGLSARNKEQSMAIDLIFDKDIDLITLIGKAGCGKSLIAIAAALDLVINKKEYERLIIYRPVQPVGNDIGYLPGTMEEKLAPWFSAIMDSFELLFSAKNGGAWRQELEMYQKRGRIELDAITYIRGRSIPNAIMLIDEAQNLSNEDVKTILTRAGEGTKIILTGDIEQIDNRDLDATDNGLTNVIEKFKNSWFAGHMTFTQGERSRLATEAAKIL